MGKLTVINDTHCGVVRSGGTTPKSAWALRQWNLQRLDALLSAINTDLLVLGDLLDTYSIPYLDLWEVVSHLVKWLAVNPDCTLFLVPGNHDLSKTTSTMSSFQFLCRMLHANSNRVVVMDKPGRLKGHDAYVIPHVPNQDLFDLELDKVPDDVATLYLHCNYNNHFAQQSDHSLNLSEQRARDLPVKRIVFAHEHQHRTMLGGKVIVIGNQIPTSVADCIGPEAKYMLEVGVDYTELRPVWEAAGSFAKVDWRDLGSAPAGAQFIRVEGDASAVEASSVVSAISKLRNTHNAFVITNAVKIEGRSLESSLETKGQESVQNFSIMDALKRRLSEAQWAVVTELLEGEERG